MVHERIGGGETGPQLVTAFQSVSKRAVAPILAALREEPSEFTTDTGLLARARIETGTMRVDFNCYEPDSGERKDDPEYRYEVGIQEIRPSGGFRQGATFKVLDQERLGRELRVNMEGMLSLHGVSRALDGEEGHALLDYMIAPHLDDGSNLALVMRRTPEDEAEIEAEAARTEEQQQKLQDKLHKRDVDRQKGIATSVRVAKLPPRR